MLTDFRGQVIKAHQDAAVLTGSEDKIELTGPAVHYLTPRLRDHPTAEFHYKITSDPAAAACTPDTSAGYIETGDQLIIPVRGNASLYLYWHTCDGADGAIVMTGVGGKDRLHRIATGR